MRASNMGPWRNAVRSRARAVAYWTFVVFMTGCESQCLVTDPRADPQTSCGARAGEIRPSTIVLDVNETMTLDAGFGTVPNALKVCALETTTINWTTDNAQVVRVESTVPGAFVDANHYEVFGSAVIRAVGQGGPVTIGAHLSAYHGYTTVTVSAPAATVDVSSPSPIVMVGTPVRLSAIVKDAGGNSLGLRPLRWTSSAEGVATVDVGSGQVSGVSTGVVTITATDIKSGKSGSISLEVRIPIATLEVEPPLFRLGVGAQRLLTPILKSSSGAVIPLTNRDVAWTTDNAGVATVAEQQNQAALATARGNGSTRITATVEGVSGFATIFVDPPIDRVIVTPATVQMDVGQSRTATASVVDAAGNALPGHVIDWTSSAPTVASVAPTSGIAPSTVTISGLATGTATLIASSEGKSATVNVTVGSPVIPVSFISITPANSSLLIGATGQFTVRTFGGTPQVELTGRGITWKSLNTAVAQVSAASGASPSTIMVTAVGAGSTHIEATSEGLTASANVIVTVPPPPPRIAYAVADQESSPSYTANPLYAYNSRGGAITITKLATGSYRVSFPGQRPLPGEVETVLVTSFGPTIPGAAVADADYCKVASWGNGAGQSLDANVLCFALGGAAKDAQFSITLLGGDALIGRFGFGFANQAGPGPAYTPAKSVHSGTGPVRVSHVAPGQYDVTFPGSAGNSGEAEGIMVTAVGTQGERCQPADALIGEVLRVNCWSSIFDEDVAADATFVFVMLTSGRAGYRAAYALVEDTDVILNGGTLDLLASVRYNSSGGGVRVVRQSKGEFDVIFFGLSPAGASRALGVQVVDQDEDDSDMCTIVKWDASTPNLVVRVNCFHTDGSLDDDAFFIMVIE